MLYIDIELQNKHIFNFPLSTIFYCSESSLKFFQDKINYELWVSDESELKAQILKFIYSP